MTDPPQARPKHKAVAVGEQWRARRAPAAVRRATEPENPRNQLSVLGGLAALSLDALSSVAYGPEAMVLVLILAGTGALSDVVPLTLTITGMLVLLVVSYTQVIQAHPDGGGSYAVAKQDLGRMVSLLAAAAVIVDYVLTVAVSLAAGAASLASVFPGLSGHPLVVCLIGLAVLTAVNMFGIAESARFLMLPTIVFVLSIFAVIIVGALHPHPVAVIGTRETFKATEALSVLLVLKAFASGCSAVTGVEAISNGVPAFKAPRIGTAQRTEVSLGVLLAVMLVGLSILIRAHHVMPRGGVTILAQVTAGAFGTGWPFYVSNLAVTLVLGLAANTSFGGLPVLMNLLAKDNRLPHMFALRSERPVYRHGIVALAVLAALLLMAVNGNTERLIPLFTIGVFVGFTISQTGMILHWRRTRGPGWRWRAVLNGAGAIMTAIAVVVFVLTKFLAGAWVVIVAIPVLMTMFARIEGYYTKTAVELGLGKTPPPPERKESVIIVPIATVSRVTERVLTAALSMSETVIALAVAGDEEEREQIKRGWDEWKSGVPIEIIVDPHRSLVRTVVHYVKSIQADDVVITVLITEIEPRKRRHEILHNQRGAILATALRFRTDVVVATVPFRLHD